MERFKLWLDEQVIFVLWLDFLYYVVVVVKNKYVLGNMKMMITVISASSCWTSIGWRGARWYSSATPPVPLVARARAIPRQVSSLSAVEASSVCHWISTPLPARLLFGWLTWLLVEVWLALVKLILQTMIFILRLIILLQYRSIFFVWLPKLNLIIRKWWSCFGCDWGELNVHSVLLILAILFLDDESLITFVLLERVRIER